MAQNNIVTVLWQPNYNVTTDNELELVLINTKFAWSSLWASEYVSLGKMLYSTLIILLTLTLTSTFKSPSKKLEPDLENE